MKTVAIALLWHLHQPYYTDSLSRSALFPWVRLHATKGYFDMGVVLDEHPAMRVTVNLTPTLLLQIQEQAEGKMNDVFWTHAAQPATDLTEEQRKFVVRHFFAANWETLVRPHERYFSLLIQRGMDVREQDLPALARRFSVQDLLDLQVWHNLAWCGHRAVARFPILQELRQKGRHFTESDKHAVLGVQREVLNQLIPLFRKLSERGQIELSTTPFFHPILPLLIDTDFARRSRPEAALPPRFAHPEDAEAQLSLAVEFHAQLFGRRPVGLWPSEGSVCPELIPMLSKLGFRWLATDEGILANSIDSWNRDEQLYRPYALSADDGTPAVFFRDRELSDTIGFTYSKTDPVAAVEDFCSRLATAGQRSSESRPVVSVILDGENPWEYYHDGGEGFLRGLYRAIERQDLVNVRFEAVTPARELAEHPPTTQLKRLHSGSWINSDFRIWIGHQEDNDGWERIGTTRRFLERKEQEGTQSPDMIRAAWREIYAAEGSDWFWWYGDDFYTDHKETFDQLFRLHLSNVYRILGDEVPELLKIPVMRQGAADVTMCQPVAFISPKIDGLVTDFFEWRSAGSIDGHAPLSAMYKGPSVFSRIYFGFNLEHLFLRFDPAPAGAPGKHSLEVQVQFLQPQAAKLVFQLDVPSPPRLTLLKSEDGVSFVEDRFYDTIRRVKIIELSIPWKDLAFHPGDTVELLIKVLEDGAERERIPIHQPLVLKVPDHTFESIMWRA